MVEALEIIFAKHIDSERAVKMKAYMKQKFDYFGIASPIRKDIQKPVFAELPLL